MNRNDIKDKRRQQLINATIDSIAKRGLTETTITHISKGAGLSRGIVNFYFTSKEAMMREVLGSMISQYEAAWKSSLKDGMSPRERLEAVVKAHFEVKICSLKRLNVMTAFWGHAATHDAYREKIDTSDIALQAVLENCWKEMTPSGYNPAQFARQLHAMIRGLWLSFLMAPKSVAREALAAECMAFIDRHQEPLRVVVNEVPVPAKAAKEVPAKEETAKAKPKPKKEEDQSQFAFGDLFAQM